MRKKIAIIIPSLRGGGAEKVMINIVNHINRSKFIVKLIVVKKEGPYINKVSKDVEVIDLNSDRVRHSVLKLIRVLNKFEPDTILSTLGHLNLVVLGIRKFLNGTPKIIVREASTPSKSIKELTKLKQILFKILYQRLYPTADTIIAQCIDMKTDIINFYNIKSDKVVHIYNPIEHQFISEEATKENPYDDNNINIISVGRLTYAKGYDVLIEAFSKILKTFPNAKLTILGDGDLREELLEQIKKNDLSDYINLIGFKDNPYPYYYYADLFVLSSRREGLPNSMIESLACKTKIVATNCKSGPREILEGNEYGELVKVDDSESLSNGIIKMLSKKIEIPEKAALRYDVKNIIKEYETILY